MTWSVFSEAGALRRGAFNRKERKERQGKIGFKKQKSVFAFFAPFAVKVSLWAGVAFARQTPSARRQATLGAPPRIV
jgi:hypothetical protein